MSTIITKNSATSGSIPSSLVQGELAINVTDNKLFYGSGSGGTVLEFLPTADTGSVLIDATFSNPNLQFTEGDGSTFDVNLSSLVITSASYALTASNAPAYLPLTGGTISGNVTVTGTASIAFLNVTVESSSVIYSSGSNQLGDASNDTQTLYGSIIVPTGSLTVNGNTNITGSVNVTGSTFKWNGNTVTTTNNDTGKATHVPYFDSNFNFATSSIYQSGSVSVIINQDSNTTSDPEALFVWQPHPTSFNIISGKGNLNNYAQLNIHNLNAGTSASSDVVATADNGTEFDKFVDMGINGSNYIDNGNGIGTANDAYLYSTGNDLLIGNFSTGQRIKFFNEDPSIFSLTVDPNSLVTIDGTARVTGSLIITGSSSQLGNITLIGNQTVTGNQTTTGNAITIGTSQITGSTSISGSFNLKGNSNTSGSWIHSGSLEVLGISTVEGYSHYHPSTMAIPPLDIGGYVYTSGSLGDLYFAQSDGVTLNNIKLRWLEGNMYSGLLAGGMLTSQSSTVYQVSSGSGIIVDLGGSLSADPYPTVQYLRWGNLSASIAPYSASYDITSVAIQSSGSTAILYTQPTPFTDGQYDSLIPLGFVPHLNRSTITSTPRTIPSLGYGWKQRSFTFIQAFGPLKLSGLEMSISGSSTGSLVVSSGYAFADGANYINDQDNPSYITDTGTTTCSIFRIYQSGSTYVIDSNAGAGYGAIDPANYNNNGVITPVPGTGANREWSIQRVYWIPAGPAKKLLIYYGNTTYPTEIDAISNISSETFTEAPITAQQAIYLGALVLRNNANFATNGFSIKLGGLFRNVNSGGGGSSTTTALSGLSDVNISSPTDGQPLVYDSSIVKWKNASTLTANLTGNASTATSASYATTASYALNAGASVFPYTGTAAINGALIVTGSTISTGGFTGSLQGTSSYATTSSLAITALSVISASYAAYAPTSSYSTNFTITSTLAINGTLTDSDTVASTIVGNNNLFTQATGSHTAAFGKYTVYGAANSRAGEFMTSWNGVTTVYTDTSTKDIGDTSDITFESSIVGGDVLIDAVALSSGWTVKMLVTYI